MYWQVESLSQGYKLDKNSGPSCHTPIKKITSPWEEIMDFRILSWEGASISIEKD